MTIVTVSLVPVDVARLHCYDVFWDDYPSIQVISSSLVSLLGLEGTTYLEKTLATCHRWALFREHLFIDNIVTVPIGRGVSS